MSPSPNVEFCHIFFVRYISISSLTFAGKENSLEKNIVFCSDVELVVVVVGHGHLHWRHRFRRGGLRPQARGRPDPGLRKGLSRY